MLQWRIETGDEKLAKEIKRVQRSFDKWFEGCWSDRCTKERMLSEKSPVKHIYYKMTKSFDEIKKVFPYEVLEECWSCGKYVDRWISVKSSLDELDDMILCKECADKLKEGIEKL